MLSTSNRFSGITIMTRALSMESTADGAGEFALHGAQVIGALDEIGDTEVGLVENLEAHAFARGIPLAASCMRIR